MCAEGTSDESPVDWAGWSPTELATLLFVLPGGGRILLIRKKRGLGQGLLNGPGGRVDPGETPAAAAVREVKEELLIDVADPVPAGRLRFHFLDGYRLEVFVFRVREFQGEPRETGEAIPVWASTEAMPYDQMWADDPLWIPLMLRGISFEGCFVFDGSVLLWHHVTSVEAVPRQERGEPLCKF